MAGCACRGCAFKKNNRSRRVRLGNRFWDSTKRQTQVQKVRAYIPTCVVRPYLYWHRRPGLGDARAALREGLHLAIDATPARTVNASDNGGGGGYTDNDRSLLRSALIGRGVGGGPPNGHTQRGHVRDVGEPLLVTASRQPPAGWAVLGRPHGGGSGGGWTD